MPFGDTWIHDPDRPWEDDGPMSLTRCEWCDLEGPEMEFVQSYDRPDGETPGPRPVWVHIECLEQWNDRTDALPGRTSRG